MDTDIIIAKATSMVVLGGTAFIVTLIPVLISRQISSRCPEDQRKNSQMDFILSLFLSFGGGVLLCTTFLHLLPEVSENIEELQQAGHIPKDLPLPLPELIMCCGFFVMYIVEEVVHKFLHSRQRQVSGRDNLGMTATPSVLIDTQMTLTETYKEVLNQDVLNQDVLRANFSPPHDEDVKIITTVKNYGTRADSEVNHNHDPHSDHGHEDHGHQHEHVLVTEGPPSLRELLIVLALTVHEGFEGIAIGLEATVGSVWYLMTAVAVHKCVIAFCIGVELVSGNVSTALSVFYAFLYSCASPFGIGIGLFLTSSSDSIATVLLSVVLQGIATGTLLYVVFFEILKRDGRNHVSGGFTQMLVVITGFVSMAAITMMISE